MSQLLEIPDSLFSAIKKAADVSGITPIEWIAANLPDAEKSVCAKAEQRLHPQTLTDLFAGRIGRIRSGGKEHLSKNCNVNFADYLVEKRGGHYL